MSFLQKLKRANARLSALRWLVQDLSVPTMPEYVCFNLSTACNLSCPHCPSHGTPEAKRWHNDPSGNMPAGDSVRLAQEVLPFAREFSLTLTGEPMSLPSFGRILDTCAPSGAKLHLVTNATHDNVARWRSLIPVAGVIQISADGGTPRVFEALRRGARYPAFLHNARLLGRTLELLSDRYTPYFGLTSVAMGSNLRDLPEVVRLAHFVRASRIQINAVIPQFPEHEDERLERHQPRFNYYRARALEVGASLGVAAEIFTPPYPGVVPDPALVRRPGMILQPPPGEDYYASLPPLERWVDVAAIDAAAAALAGELRRAPVHPAGALDAARYDALHARLEDDSTALASRHAPRLRALAARPEEPVVHCIHLQQRSYVRADGVVLACSKPDLGPMGNALEGSWERVWNGPTRHAVVADFRDRRPPRACLGCEQNRAVPVRWLLNKAFPDGVPPDLQPAAP